MKKLVYLLILCLCINGFAGVSLPWVQSARAASKAEEKAEKKSVRQPKADKSARQKKTEKTEKKSSEGKAGNAGIQAGKSTDKGKKAESAKEKAYTLDLAKNSQVALSVVLEYTKMDIKLKDIKSIELEDKNDKKYIAWEQDEENKKDYIFTVLKNFKEIRLRIITKKSSNLLVLKNGAKDSKAKEKKEAKPTKTPKPEATKATDEGGKEAAAKKKSKEEPVKEKQEVSAVEEEAEATGEKKEEEAEPSAEEGKEAPAQVSEEATGEGLLSEDDKQTGVEMDEGTPEVVEIPAGDGEEDGKAEDKAAVSTTEDSQDGSAEAPGEAAEAPEEPTEGQEESAKAQDAPTEEQVEPAEAQGESVAPQGEPVEGQGESTEAQGSSEGGQGVSAGAQAESTDAQDAPAEEQEESAKAQDAPIDEQGEPAEAQGEPVASQGEAVEEKVESTEAQDTPVDEQGESVGAQGGPDGEQSSPIEEQTGSPEGSGESAEEPVESTEAPGDAVEEPGESSEEPVESTAEPGEAAEEPGESTEEPGEPAGEPGGSSEDPGSEDDGDGKDEGAGDEAPQTEKGALIPETAEVWFKRGTELLWGTLEEVVSQLTGGETVYIQTEKLLLLRKAPLEVLSTVTMLPDSDAFKGGYSVCFSTDNPTLVSQPVLIQPVQMPALGETADLYIWVRQDEEPAPEDQGQDGDDEKPVLKVRAKGFESSGWSRKPPRFTLSGIPEDKEWSYAAIIYDERIVPIASNVFVPDQEGIYTLRFAMINEIGDIMSASDQYTLQLDWTEPEVAIEADEEESYTLNISATDKYSGLDAVSVDRGKTWHAIDEEGYTIREKAEKTFKAGAIRVRDVAGNVFKSEEAYTLEAVESDEEGEEEGEEGGEGGGGGGGGSGTPTLPHSSGDGEEGVDYDALALDLPDEPMEQLTVGGEPMALTLMLTSAQESNAPVGDNQPFTAQLRHWADASGSTDLNTLLLSAEIADDLGDVFSYEWRFNGEVYRLLANSGIKYVALEVGDAVAAFPTEGFTGGTRYTELKMQGVSTRKFDYTLTMKLNLDPSHISAMTESDYSQECDLSIHTAVEGTNYELSNSPQSMMYFYNVFLGPEDMLDRPFGEYDANA